MVAGYGAFTAAQAAGQGFIASFVEGGKVFLSTLTGMGGKEGATGATQANPGVIDTAQVSQATTEASNLAVQAGGAPELVGQTGQAAEAASAATQGGRLTEAATQAAAAPGMAEGAATAGSQQPVTRPKRLNSQRLAVAHNRLRPVAVGCRKLRMPARPLSITRRQKAVARSLVRSFRAPATTTPKRIDRNSKIGFVATGCLVTKAPVFVMPERKARAPEDCKRRMPASRAAANEGGGRPFFQRPYGAGAGG
jgi:hypothetical protein